MKLGLDIHGVLDHNPELFTHLASKYVEIHIITGGSFVDNKYDIVLKDYQIEYLPELNFYLGKSM